MAKVEFRGVVGTRNLSKTRSRSVKGRSQKQFTQATRNSLAEFDRKVKDTLEALEAATEAAVYNAMQPIFNKSQDYCPFATGALRDSGELNVVEVSRNKIKAEITYGAGGFPHYAAIVHERVDLYHEPPTRSKFLQAALEEGVGEVRGNLIATYKAFVGF